MRHSISVEVNWNLQQWTTTEKNKVWQAPYPATMVLRHWQPPLPFICTAHSNRICQVHCLRKLLTLNAACFCKIQLTKYEGVEALVVHVLVQEHPLVLVDAAAEQPDEVPVLELGDQLHLVLELHRPLHRSPGQPLHGYFLPVLKLPLSAHFAGPRR